MIILRTKADPNYYVVNTNNENGCELKISKSANTLEKVVKYLTEMAKREKRTLYIL